MPFNTRVGIDCGGPDFTNSLCHIFGSEAAGQDDRIFGALNQGAADVPVMCFAGCT